MGALSLHLRLVKDAPGTLVQRSIRPSRPSLTPRKRLLYRARTMSCIVIVTTVGTEEQANLIARELVARRQAACVNVLPGIRSFYRWQGKICSDGELMLIVKSLAQEFEAVRQTIQELHEYDVPEILAFTVSQGDESFLEWIGACLDKDADFPDDEDDEDPTLVDLGELSDRVL